MSAFLAWIIPTGDAGLHPSHPIVIPPGTPPSGGDGEGPHPSHPIVLPPGLPIEGLHPSHPIVIPPTAPPGIPPGGDTGSPTHPINLPPTDPPGSMQGYWALAFFPDTGWMWVWVPVGKPSDMPPPAEPKKK